MIENKTTSFSEAFKRLVGRREGDPIIQGAQPCGDGVVFRGAFGWYRVPDGLDNEAANKWGKEEDLCELARMRS